MTKDKFQLLCEKILIPLIGHLLHQQLTELHDLIDVMGQEMVRIGIRLDRMEALCAPIAANDSPKRSEA